ncbi:LuxR C-terminal-related transcriptional regulator [Kitasatospora sp. NPDC056327]|uniref:LuxR C-terminal-related transcriptional regulator n=1 Tax=Kitasatospora sp. NPDC056327 TaxID=3345785 RepID=UPI0035E0B8E7
MTDAYHASVPEYIGGHALDIALLVPNEMARFGLRTMLSTISVRHLTEVDSFASLTEQLAHVRFDMLIISCTGHDVDQLHDPLREIASHGVKILFLLENTAQHLVLQAASLPVDGFLIQSELTRHALADALRRINDGELSMPTALARELLSQVRERGSTKTPRPVSLTPREQQVLTLVGDGLSNKQIARRLAISEHGAKRHVANVLAKLNSPNRTLAVVTALKEGLLPAHT